MYRQYYALKKKPFELVPDPEYLFLSDSHKEGLAMLRYGVVSEKNFLLLTGGIGTGKTTLVNCLTDKVKENLLTCLITNPLLSVKEFYTYLAVSLDLMREDNKAVFHLSLAKLLKECSKTGKKVLIIIDEAHLLSLELLEEIRLLINLAPPGKNTLCIFFVGQPELLEILSDERLRALRQRIFLRFHLNPLSEKDTRNYVQFRLQCAGGARADLFSDAALQELHAITGGIPRLINAICDTALLVGYTRNVQQIGPEIIDECMRQHQLPGEKNTGGKRVEKGWWRWKIPFLTVVALVLCGGLGVAFLDVDLVGMIREFVFHLFT